MRRRSRSTASDASLEEPLLGGGGGGGGEEASAPPSAPPRRTPAAPSAQSPYSSRAIIPWRAPAAIFLALWDFVHRAVAGILGPLCPPGLRPGPRASPRAAAAAAGLASALATRFDTADPAHAAALADLWAASFPGTPAPSPIAPDRRWRDAGWQGDDPRTDLRGGGLGAVRAALHLARARPALWARLRHKDRGPAAYVADLEYPFGAAGVAVAVLTAQAAGLVGGRGAVALPPPPGPPTSPAGVGFLRLLDATFVSVEAAAGGGSVVGVSASAATVVVDTDDEGAAFAVWADLAAAAYERLDRDWEAARAEYMAFPALAAGVREALEGVLGGRGVASVGDVRAGLGLER
jgi:hypothetical protein